MSTNTKFCEDLNLPFDYKLLAITETHVLVFNPDKEEYVSYSHDNNGNSFSGVYTQSRKNAIDNFVSRMRVYL